MWQEYLVVDFYNNMFELCLVFDCMPILAFIMSILYALYLYKSHLTN